MKIATITVETPFTALGDNALSAGCDWAHKVARALVDTNTPPKSLPAIVRTSPEYAIIEQHTEFLKAPDAAIDSKAPKALRLHKIAAAWAEKLSGPRIYIDPMLLGGKPYKDIAAELDDGRSSKKDLELLVKLYETLFMHCRRPNGSLLPQTQLYAMALDDRIAVGSGDPDYIHWRVKAATQGYEAVEPLWGHKPPDQDLYAEQTLKATRQLTYGHLETRMRTGAASNEDLISAASFSESVDKRKADERAAASTGTATDSEAFSVLTRVLALLGPQRVPVEDYQNNVATATAADKRNLASAQKIGKTAVADRGPAGAHAAIDKDVKKHVAKGAANQEKPKK